MNPRIKKIGRNILFLLSIPGIVGAFVFANLHKQDQKLSGIHINIENTALSFVTEKNVLDMIEAQGVQVNESVINEVKINTLENVIKENEWVSDAEIFVTANHAMNIQVKQKTPIVRINQQDSVDYAYYLDEYANPINLSTQYIAKVPVATVPALKYSRKDLRCKHDLVSLAKYIQKDSFWNAMITQINIDKHYQIELIPALGNQLIRVGSIDELDSKMKRLLSFYQNGIQTIDWNRYNEIDIRFAHQVVARNTNVLELVDKTIEKEQLEKAKIWKEKMNAQRFKANAIAKKTSTTTKKTKP